MNTTPQLMAHISQLHQTGLSFRKMQTILGISKSRLHRLLQQADNAPPASPPSPLGASQPLVPAGDQRAWPTGEPYPLADGQLDSQQRRLDDQKALLEQDRQRLAADQQQTQQHLAQLRLEQSLLQGQQEQWIQNKNRLDQDRLALTRDQFTSQQQQDQIQLEASRRQTQQIQLTHWEDQLTEAQQRLAADQQQVQGEAAQLRSYQQTLQTEQQRLNQFQEALTKQYYLMVDQENKIRQERQQFQLQQEPPSAVSSGLHPSVVCRQELAPQKKALVDRYNGLLTHVLTYCRGHRWPAQYLADFMDQGLQLSRDLMWFCRQHQIDLSTLLIGQGMNFMLDDMNKAYERTTGLFGVNSVKLDFTYPFQAHYQQYLTPHFDVPGMPEL